MSAQDPLAKILSHYCNVNAFDINQLSQNLQQKQISETEASTFQKQLAEAITHHTLTPTEYKKITGDNGSPKQVRMHCSDVRKAR
jgi:predicted metal-binding transcription factor (methanogenesis marker protein 9)